MAKRPITIQMFYPTGDTRGFRIAEITNSIIEALLIPRKELEAVLQSRPELDSSGLYFLFAKDTIDNERAIEAYIGESETIKDRLKQHNMEKDFWEVAIVFISSNQRWQLNKADIKFLEHTAYKKAKSAKRYFINQNIPTKSPVTEAREADLTDLLVTIDILLTSLGYPIFTELIPNTEINTNYDQTFYTTYRESNAKGIYTNEGFVVMKGSVVSSKEESKGFKMHHVLEDLIDRGVIDQNGVFTEDHLFNSPSTAIDVILKASYNGWNSWKNDKGLTLHDIYRAD
ncbi:GIY-YIG nuclease family protein [Carnobacterium mobile]|uniref:GIY-YIG nuclease family protein n=1 Tax=Carnobacterium mobile TaxID=2750 RepID=UPI00054EC322|nr:GIY-YIG nuclease family protein [Carnobacterium mobile]